MGDGNTPTGSEYAMLYYGLGIVFGAAVLLLASNIIVIRCCTDRSSTRRRVTRTPAPTLEQLSKKCHGKNLKDIPSFKYRNDEEAQMELSAASKGDGIDCAVCLSMFEDGEDIKELPKCNHSFHAPCIDMWLYSHSDCPICRTVL